MKGSNGDGPAARSIQLPEAGDAGCRKLDAAQTRQIAHPDARDRGIGRL